MSETDEHTHQDPHTQTQTHTHPDPQTQNRPIDDRRGDVRPSDNPVPSSPAADEDALREGEEKLGRVKPY